MATIDKQTFHTKAVEYGAMHLLDQPRRPVPEPEGATMLELSRLSKRFGSLQALDDLSLSLDRGEIVGFVGSNGAGKSTTMRIVMGVLAADSGAAGANKTKKLLASGRLFWVCRMLICAI